MPDDREPVLRIQLPTGRIAQVFEPGESLWEKIEALLRGKPVRPFADIDGACRELTAEQAAAWLDSDLDANIGLVVMELVVVECTDLPTIVCAGGPPAWPRLVGKILETWPDSTRCYYWKCMIRALVQKFVDHGREFIEGFDNTKVREKLDADARASAESLLSALRERMGKQDNEAEASGENGDPQQVDGLPDLVTLDQAAAAVHTSKRTLERYKTKNKLPDPVVEGGGGKAALYDWKILRPWLTENFGINLPERFPGNVRKRS